MKILFVVSVYLVVTQHSPGIDFLKTRISTVSVAYCVAATFFGRLRKSEVPEPESASTKLGRLRLITLKFVILSSFINACRLLDHIYLYKMLLSHVWHKAGFCLSKRCSRLRLSAPANKKISFGSTLKSGGSRRLRLRNTGYSVPVLRIRIYYYADPGSKKCPYGSGS